MFGRRISITEELLRDVMVMAEGGSFAASAALAEILETVGSGAEVRVISGSFSHRARLVGDRLLW